jgi:hypothetical protein
MASVKKSNRGESGAGGWWKKRSKDKKRDFSNPRLKKEPMQERERKRAEKREGFR